MMLLPLVRVCELRVTLLVVHPLKNLGMQEMFLKGLGRTGELLLMQHFFVCLTSIAADILYGRLYSM